MTKRTKDLVKELYNSPDPLCIEAAVNIERLQKAAKTSPETLDLLIKNYELYSIAVDEIGKIAFERDNPPKTKPTERELETRLNEVVDIALDTSEIVLRNIEEYDLKEQETLRKQQRPVRSTKSV